MNEYCENCKEYVEEYWKVKTEYTRLSVITTLTCPNCGHQVVEDVPKYCPLIGRPCIADQCMAWFDGECLVMRKP